MYAFVFKCFTQFFLRSIIIWHACLNSCSTGWIIAECFFSIAFHFDAERINWMRCRNSDLAYWKLFFQVIWKHGKALVLGCQIGIHFPIQITRFLVKYNFLSFQILIDLNVFLQNMSIKTPNVSKQKIRCKRFYSLASSRPLTYDQIS